MTYILLDGAEMTSRYKAHLYFKESFDLPAYYGENLDALWDELSTLAMPVTVEVINTTLLAHHLQDYGIAIMDLLKDIARVNSQFHLIMDEPLE